MAAVLRVDLCETEDLRIGQWTTVFLLQSVQILDFLWAQSQTFLLVIFLQIVHILDRLGFDVDGKNVLVQSSVHTLQHLVVLSILRVYGEVLLYTRNAAEAHILCNLNGICRPWGHHFATWTNIVALKLLSV